MMTQQLITNLKRKENWPIFGLFGLLVITFLRYAWVTDDAYITFRVVQNFTHGYGPVFNLGQRVQVYTHPLWFFNLSAVYWFVSKALLPLGVETIKFLGGLYPIAILLSLTYMFGAVWLMVYRVAASRMSAIIGIIVLIFSKAFIEYSSSGLENPLTYFLIALFVTIYCGNKIDGNKRIFILSFITALGTLNRMDTILMLGPALAFEIWQARDKIKAAWQMLTGFMIFIVWEIFSLVYYGFLFPNTAYAKLNHGIPARDIIAQGWLYFQDSFKFDLLTLSIILAAVAIPLLKKQARLAVFSLGLILYLGYVLKVGGDFMSGRFFASPLILAVLTLSQFRLPNKKFARSILILVVLTGMLGRHPGLFQVEDNVATDELIQDSGIADERRYYFERYGLQPIIANKEYPPAFNSEWTQWQSDGAIVEVIRYNVLGVFGYEKGPTIHVFDRLALAEPLLARLPIEDLDKWRIGHFRRDIPDDLFATLLTGKNKIDSPPLRKYYNKLSVVIRGDLFAPGRFTKIWKLNTGQYDYLIEKHVEQND